VRAKESSKPKLSKSKPDTEGDALAQAIQLSVLPVVGAETVISINVQMRAKAVVMRGGVVLTSKQGYRSVPQDLQDLRDSAGF